MTYDLFLGDRLYSSWSLRGWLACAAFDIPCRTHMMRLYGGKLQDDLRDLAPAKTVPVLRTPEGAVLWDSLAMAEELATRHPDAGLWPSDPLLRSTARSLVAEMHSGFAALRSACPMNLLNAYADSAPSADTLSDVCRLEMIWGHAFSQHDGPWLCGEYSLADVAYAPVAARIAGYALPVSDRAARYVAAHLAHPRFRQWRAMGLAAAGAPQYQMPYDTRHWPGPHALDAAACDGPSVNETCPYSGKPVTDFLRYDGQIYGFCNAFCRDKTLHDPAAWPAFIALSQRER
ncbi:MAG: glutathione S-transferase [Rhodobacteraceae bacterium]|nr:glutathione S-transferase [Paracoccaceae bacterium]